MDKRILLLGIAPLLLALFPALTVSTDIPANVTVTSYITATFEYASVEYGSLSAGTANQSAPNQAAGVYNVTVDTNKNYTVQASGTDFSGDGYSFSISNLLMDTNDVVGNLALADAVALSSTPQTIDTNIDYAVTTHYHGFWLSIPSGQYAALYTSTLTITYSNV